MYHLYTLPMCHTCHEVKVYLNEKGVEYKEVNLGQREGKREFGKVYFQISGRLKRDENGMTMPPIFVKFNDESKIESVAQELEDIIKILSGE